MRPYFRHESRLRDVRSLTMDSDWNSISENQVRTFQEDTKFQQTVFMCFQNFVSSNNGDSPAALNNFQAVATDLGTESDMKEWDRILSKYLENMQLEDDDNNIKEFCLAMFDGLLHGNSGRCATSNFILCAQVFVKTLAMSKPNVIGPMKKQLRNLEKMLEFILIIALAAEKKNRDKKLQKFMEYIKPWVNSAAAVPFVFWVDEVDEKLCTLLSSFLEKFNPRTPELVEVYLGAVKSLKAPEELKPSRGLQAAHDEEQGKPLKPSGKPEEPKEQGADEGSEELKESEELEKSKTSENSDSEESENYYSDGSDESDGSQESKVLLVRDALWRFVDILLQNLIVSTDDDRVETLSEVLVLLTAFLMDPPQAYAEDEKLTMAQTNLLVDKAASLISSLSSGKLREDIVEERNILLHELLEKINNAKAELRDFHVGKPMLSGNNVPHTNEQGSFNLFQGNLEKKVQAEADLFPFEKHQMAIVQKELMLLKPFLVDIFDLQDEHEELKDIWVRASNAAYLVDFVTDACLSFDLPVWSTIIHLSNAIKEIQLVKTQADKIRNNKMYSSVLSAKMKSKLILIGREHADDKIEDDFKVGFMEEEEALTDRLTRGVDEFDIVAIVGMPGQGKTTLARRVLHNPCVQNHFKKCAWCSISQAYDLKKILADILKGIGEPVPEEEISSLSQDDLANSLRKCLLTGGSYLIVLDDIWDIKPWKELRVSFPDNKGSRILFTSRNHNVALEAKSDSYVVELHPLTLEDSWKLLQLKVFGKEECPETLSDTAETIAENCKGLPLAIVLVAGLLKKDTNLESWKQVAQSLTLNISSGSQCIDIIELSYNHLPDVLKPCFLYLGAFEEDEVIDVKRLMQLWITEGLVQNDGTQSLEAVANQYFINLINRSLVLVAKRSSKNGIKKCRVHDLLHEFCIMKAVEERFLLVPNASNQSSSTRYNPYRVCVGDKWIPSVDSASSRPPVRSLIFHAGSQRHFSFGTPSPVTLRFKLLRVLDLQRIYIRSALGEITQLIHLRFLAVVCDKNIPASIVNLIRLEYLHLEYLNSERFLPSVLLNLVNLKHINVICLLYFVYIKDGGEELEQLQPLANLDTFTHFKFDDALFFEKVARKLPNVRKLGLELEFCVHLSSLFDKLESLYLVINKDISPSNFDLPSTLKKLTLDIRSKALSANMLSSIGQLSNLEVLKLDADVEDRRWDVEDDEFLNLKYLKISNSNIQEWNASDESFPHLQQLVVKYCNLIELPSRFAELSTLKRIHVRGCNQSISSSFQQIVDDQKDSGNDALQFSIANFRSNGPNIYGSDEVEDEE